MKKFLSVAVILILGGTVAVPYINGLILEKTLEDLMAEANALSSETDSGYSLEILSYDRNFFSSDIDWRLTLGTLKKTSGVDAVVFSDHARHGYTGVTSTTSLEKNPWFNRFIEEKAGGKNPFTLRTSYSLFGDITSEAEMESFTVSAERQEIRVGEGRFVISTDDLLQRFSASASWLGLDGGNQVSLADVNMETEMAQISAFLWEGFFTFSLGSLQAVQPQGRFTIGDSSFTYSLEADMDTDLATTEAAFSADSIVAAGTTIDGARGALSLNNMSARGYEKLLRAYSRMTAEAIAGMQDLEEPSADAGVVLQKNLSKFSFQIIAALEKLLRKDLEFHLSDLLIGTDDGDISADIQLRLLKDMTLMQFAPIVSRPSLALEVFHLESSASLPETIIDDPSLLLAPLHPGMETGLFIVTDGRLSHTAETREGELYLNDRLVDLDAGSR